MTTVAALLLASVAALPHGSTPAFPSPGSGSESGLRTAMQSSPTRPGVAAPSDPWPGRPNPPLLRVKPRGYTVGYAIDIGATSQTPLVPDPFASAGGSITFEPVLRDTWTLADLDRRAVSVRLNGSPVNDGARLEGDPAGIDRRLVVEIPDGEVNTLSVRATWPAIAFNSVVDEPGAARIAWPRDWPAETRRFLSPSFAIDSDDPIFRDFVASAAGGELRRVPVYLAAKDLVRRTIISFKNIDGSPLVREGLGAIRGFRIRGAAASARAGVATPGDLVGACVAVLRAAGIPARPIIGVYSGDGDPGDTKLPRGRTTLCAWAEFHLPGAGWVPFDPYEMRGTGLPQAKLERPWKWFGTCKDLNRRVALAYDFAPIRQGFVQDWPAGWAWTISGAVRAPFRIVDVTTPVLVSRGPVRP